MGLEIFFICHKFSFILCGAMTTNEIMGFPYVLIALPQNQYVINKLFKGWIEWNGLLQKVYFSFILCGAMTTNEIMGFSYVLIALPLNQSDKKKQIYSYESNYNSKVQIFYFLWVHISQALAHAQMNVHALLYEFWKGVIIQNIKRVEITPSKTNYQGFHSL